MCFNRNTLTKHNKEATNKESARYEKKFYEMS